MKGPASPGEVNKGKTNTIISKGTGAMKTKKQQLIRYLRLNGYSQLRAEQLATDQLRLIKFLDKRPLDYRLMWQNDGIRVYRILRDPAHYD